MSPDVAVAWRGGFSSAISHIAGRQIRLAGQDAGPFPGGTDVTRLTVLLQRVAEHVDAVDPDDLRGFVERTLRLVIRLGAGRSFELTDILIDSSTVVIDALYARGRPVADLLLVQADCHGLIANQGRRRRQVIHRALDRSRSPDERVRAMLYLARFQIDGSSYRAARRTLRGCARLIATSPGCSPYRAELEATDGLCSFFTDAGRARRQLTAIVDRYGTGAGDPIAIRAVGTAEHYLGRIAAAEGRPAEALRHYVAAEHTAGNSAAGTGFFHLRLAEVLVGSGSAREAGHHLRQAEAVFDQSQQLSSGRILLDLGWARYYQRIGAPDRAGGLLVDAVDRAREDGFPRGELIGRLELARLHRERGRRRAAAAAFLGAGVVFLRSEARLNPVTILAQLRTGWSVLTRTLVGTRASAQRGPATAVSCPCGEPHADPA